MFADVALPMTFVFDWYLLDSPFGVIAFLSVTASLIALGIFLVSRKVVPNKAAAILLCLFLFVMADLFVYAIAHRRPVRRPDREQPPVTQPVEKH